MKNRYGGDDEGKWVSCDDREQKLRVWCDDKSEALPVRLVKMDEHGATPNTYFLKNVWEEDEEAQRWVSFNWDGRWLYARYKTKEEACPIEFVPVGDGTYKLMNRYAGENCQFVSFNWDGRWLRATYSEADAMPVELVPYATHSVVRTYLTAAEKAINTAGRAAE